MARSVARASGSSGRARPVSSSARVSSRSSAASSSRFSTITWQRDSSAPFSAKDGFSVVAPTRVTVPSSTTGRKPSCWARLKRWISSTNSSVPWPLDLRARASSKARLRSATPENTADSAVKRSPAASASSRAMVVLPTPGGPHRISEASEPRSSMRAIAPSGPSRWSWPTTSASTRGRRRSASGRPAGSASGDGSAGAPNRSAAGAGLPWGRRVAMREGYNARPG